MFKMYLTLAVVLTAACLAGCSESAERFLGGRPAAPATVANLGKVSAEKAFAAAQRTLRENYGIESRDIEALSLQAVSPQYRGHSQAGTLREGLSSPSDTLRKVAYLQIGSDAAGRTIARIRIEIQRLDTAPMRAFAYQRRHSDTPAVTPIQEESPAGPEKTTVWTTLRRDRPAEQEIIEALKAQLGLSQTRPAS